MDGILICSESMYNNENRTVLETATFYHNVQFQPALFPWLCVSHIRITFGEAYLFILGNLWLGIFFVVWGGETLHRRASFIRTLSDSYWLNHSFLTVPLIPSEPRVRSYIELFSPCLLQRIHHGYHGRDYCFPCSSIFSHLRYDFVRIEFDAGKMATPHGRVCEDTA